MSGPMIFTRRRFLQQTGALGALAMASSMERLGLASAAAQAPGYKALVCVFLFGGNDSNSMVIPITNYAQYDAVRPLASNVQVPLAALQPITPTNTGGLVYGLNPAFTTVNANPSLQGLFSVGKLAVVVNAGSLTRPMTRAEYRSNLVPKPSNLFSHSDQQQQGMSSILQASTLTGINGWGGRVGDKVAGMNPPTATPMSMSFSGTQTFGTGVQVRTLALPTGGAFGFTGDNLSALPGTVAYERAAARAELLAAGDASAMVGASQVNAIVAQNASAKISPILTGTGSAAITGPFAGMNSSLANQLRAVAKVIEARATLQHNRQIFFVSIGGFDTHSGQGTTNVGAGLPSLYQQIGQALGAFYRSTELMGVVNNVTTFTLTDFNRTFKPNGQGTDHAWGGHHFVMGGSVVGNRFYGQYPDLILGGNNDTDTAGRWIPTTGFDQYGATLGRWFGVPDVDLPQVFPNLSRFPVSNLGFLG
jgi:uncharacterized protein (DUF1501 family)